MSLSLRAVQADGYYIDPDDPNKGKRPELSNDDPRTIRYEVPFKIWCLQCRNVLDKGVRTNAARTSIGKYFTTDIFKFRFTCHHCGNKIGIQSNPEGGNYLCIEGCEKKAETFDGKSINVVPTVENQTRHRLQVDPMYRLEHGMREPVKEAEGQMRLERLQAVSDIYGKTSYESNAKARALHRELRTTPRTLRTRETAEIERLKRDQLAARSKIAGQRNNKTRK